MERILSIDLETFSDIDLGNCGVYRYCESTNFHILLFAYAFDDDPVQIIDMACGEELPKEVVDAIFDPTVIKAAWNAQFERTCLSHLLRETAIPGFLALLHGSRSIPFASVETENGSRSAEDWGAEGQGR